MCLIEPKSPESFSADQLCRQRFRTANKNHFRFSATVQISTKTDIFTIIINCLDDVIMGWYVGITLV